MRLFIVFIWNILEISFSSFDTAFLLVLVYISHVLSSVNSIFLGMLLPSLVVSLLHTFRTFLVLWFISSLCYSTASYASYRLLGSAVLYAFLWYGTS